MNTETGITVVITSPDFRAGQDAARVDYAKDPEATPNRALLARLKSAEFAAGYAYEWDNYLAPMQLVDGSVSR